MKKLSIFLASLMCAVPVFSQAEEAPNRLFLKNSIGNTSGYVLDRIDELSFGRVDGEVKANAEIHSVSMEGLSVTIKRTPDCYGFKLDVIPANTATQYDDLTVITYMNRNNPQVYYEDFIEGQLTGASLDPGTDYVLVTVGVDGYGVEDGVVRVPFSTPKAALEGNPDVTAEVVDRQLKSFSIKFTPNEDVVSYYCVAGEKGQMQQQLEFFGPMMGLTSMTDLIMKWGSERRGEQVVEWTGMDPNTDYEVFYLATDINGNAADYKTIEVSTLSQGGDGAAKVDIEILEYEYSEWDGVMKPSQFIHFKPNEDSWCYRFGVYWANEYDSNAEEIKEYICSDPAQPTVYWFFYDELVTDFQIDPNTECVAVAAAKNSNGEWGEVTEVRFTTPEKAEGDPGAAAKPASISKNYKSRVEKNADAKWIDITPGKVPVVRTAKKLKLK